MAKKKGGPSEREYQVLTLIVRYSAEHNIPPTTHQLAEGLLQYILEDNVDEASLDPEWMRQEMERARKNLLTILGRMEKPPKNLVYRQGSEVYLTPKAKDIVANRGDTVGLIPAHVQVRGSIWAGPGDDLDIDPYGQVIENLLVPNADVGRRVYALRVKGISMTDEGILDGDYVIVQDFSRDGPNDGDIVVTRYREIPEHPANNPDIELESQLPPRHTLKRYVQKEGYARLSRRNDADRNPHMIKAAQIEPIGKVIGLHRIISTNR